VAGLPPCFSPLCGLDWPGTRGGGGARGIKPLPCDIAVCALGGTISFIVLLLFSLGDCFKACPNLPMQVTKVAGGSPAARGRLRSPSDAAPTRMGVVGMEQLIAEPLGVREEVSVKVFFWDIFDCPSMAKGTKRIRLQANWCLQEASWLCSTSKSTAADIFCE